MYGLDFSVMKPDQSCALTAQVFLAPSSTLLGKQDVDIISFPVIKPIVAVQWKKPSWQCWATLLMERSCV